MTQDESDKGLFEIILDVIKHLCTIVGFCVITLIVVNFILNKINGTHLFTSNWFVFSNYAGVVVKTTQNLKLDPNLKVDPNLKLETSPNLKLEHNVKLDTNFVSNAINNNQIQPHNFSLE